ncbi:hypothetical protein AGMMS50262_20360 [Bacteroidia bacterium]|nr:hypothetical protein AGMMS50262_20360 [Bacteroidia bacterium]
MKRFIFLLLVSIVGFLFVACNKEDEVQLFINLDTTEIEFAPDGGNRTVQVSGNGEWSISGDGDWLEVSPKTGKGNVAVTITVSENDSYDDRETTLLFKCGQETAKLKLFQWRKEEAQIREMLVKLYHDTDGDNWRNKDNWLSDKPINEWYGIYYSPGKLTISLLYNQLKGTIDMSSCTILWYLYCQVNQLTSLDVSGCTSLTELFCFDNQLTSLNVSGCTSLTEFSCSYNKILSEIPEWFRQLTLFEHDSRYSYYTENDETKYTDNGVGWWYPGEPGKGYHGQ